jgi:hypothetical protein
VKKEGGTGDATTGASTIEEQPRPVGRVAGMPDDCATDKDLSDSGAVRQAKVAIIAVIARFILCASVIAIATPAWESNDEPDHVKNIETLVAGLWYGITLARRPALATEVTVTHSRLLAREPRHIRLRSTTYF